MNFEIKEKLRYLIKEEKDLEKKLKDDEKTEIDAEKATLKIKKEKIKTILATLLLTGGIVGGTYLMNVSMPVQNIIAVFAIVNCYTIPMYISKTKEAREKISYAKRNNIIEEIEHDKTDIETKNHEIDYYKTFEVSTSEQKNIDNINIIENKITLESIEKEKKPMTRVRN